jgi:acetoin utilization deacetylase AcuC-like enzyme
MSVLLVTDPAFADHVAGPGHPECPERLTAVIAGARHPRLDGAVTALAPQPAPRDVLEGVHPGSHLDTLAAIAARGGGRIDADTSMSAGSWEAAQRAAGAGLSAIEALRRGEADAAFCAVRPPGHHATPTRSMGFCLVSNVAVTAMALARAGERVLVLDYDAHHGNGTQAAFIGDPRVLFVSFHQWPLYPGTGAANEIGLGAGEGYTMNLPMPAGATGEHYLAAFDEIIAPRLATFAPTWLVVSAGFDAHRRDPITSLALSAGDYAALTRRALEWVPAGRRVLMLEGGYDLQALTACTSAVLLALCGIDETIEAPTSGGPGAEHVVACRTLWDARDAGQ